MERSFDNIARLYAPLERMTFGFILHRARLDSLQHSTISPQNALILGDGDGRYTVELLKRHPNCAIDSIDISPAMHAQARQRLVEQFGQIPPNYRAIAADARDTEFPSTPYDFIGLHFFLDCFNHRDCRALIAKCTASLQAEGTLSFTDFTVPPQGFGKYFGSVLIWLLYLSFRWSTGLKTRRLPDFNWPDNLECIHQRTELFGVLENKLFRKS